MLPARSGIDNLEGSSVRLGKKLPCQMPGTLEVSVLVAKASDLGT